VATVKKLIFTDEKDFTLEVPTNRHDDRVYAKVPPQVDFSLRFPLRSHAAILHGESKKQDTKLSAITALTIIRFSIFFH